MARYIDADKLIKDIEQRRIAFKGTEHIADVLMTQGKAIRKAIENAPTADVVDVKHEEWLHKKIDEINNHVYGQCSNCLERKRIDNYCPNCGAKMDGRRDT